MERLSAWPCVDKRRWYENVHAWLTEVARSRGLGAIKSVATVKERPWSVVLRVQFPAMAAYFKASGPGGTHEPGLLAHLEARWADHIPEVLAADLERAWILTADAGQPVREVADRIYQLSVLRCVLPVYASYNLYQRALLNN